MKRRTTNLFLFLSAVLFLLQTQGMYAQQVQASGRINTSLNGEWTFAMDPVQSGEQDKWFAQEFPSAKFDKVIVPHCWSVDKRWEFYTGKAWYFKRFAGAVGAGGNSAPTGNGAAAPTGMHQFMHFDAVFYKARIWLNGQPAGEHEGGYTPFELEVTGKLKNENVLAVEVDNSWDTTTIPGAKTPVNYEPANAAQLYPWINYGGITRSVSLISRPGVYIRNIKITTDPDLKKGPAQIRIVAWLANLSGAAGRAVVHARVLREGIVNKKPFKEVRIDLPSGLGDSVVFETQLSSNEVTLWDQDHPRLYRAEVSIETQTGADTLAAAFGIRKLELAGNKLLLNGEPIKMGGANRPMDHPDFGSMDPEVVLEKDLGMMKSGCMELSRVNHYPITEAMLNWADRNGMLFIEEAGNWQMTPKQMADPLMRRKFETQMKEMVERDWNHPCLFAWSVGNEFQSQTKEGKDWVKDMGHFTRTMDPSRFITFASMMVGRDNIKVPEDEASNWVDFISINMYGNYLKNLQHVHSVYPGKAVYVSEFGIRADGVKDENARVEHLQTAMAAFRQCDYVIGANIWTFNDYRSRFPGTNANGYRPWGLITPQREPRGMYTAWQEEFAPATLTLVSGKEGTGAKDGQGGQSGQGGQLIIRVTARKDFPAYTLRDYSLRYAGKILPLRTLRPGESQEVIIGLPSSTNAIELVKPGGFVILKWQAVSEK
ncbi:glycoside hydrolase family 2 protein [Flavitalea flava]